MISTQDGKRLEPKDIRAALDKDKTLRISSTSAIGSANTRINKLLVEWGKNFHKRRENNPKSVEGDAFAALDLETYIRTEVSWSARQSNFSRRRSISTRTRRLFDSVVMWSRRYRFGRQCPPPKSDESALNETWSSSRWRACRWRAPGPTVRGPQLPICSLLNGPAIPSPSIRERYDAIDAIIKRQEGPSTGQTGRFTRRKSKEYKADVAKGCEQFDDLQALLEEHNAYCTVWKSNFLALLRWCCSVSYVCASDVYVRALLEDSFWSG